MQRKSYLYIAIFCFAISILIVLEGCSTIQPDRAFFVKQDFKIRISNIDKLRQEHYAKYTKSKHRGRVNGWHNYAKNEIVVPYSGMKDRYNRPLPDF